MVEDSHSVLDPCYQQFGIAPVVALVQSLCRCEDKLQQADGVILGATQKDVHVPDLTISQGAHHRTASERDPVDARKRVNEAAREHVEPLGELLVRARHGCSFRLGRQQRHLQLIWVQGVRSLSNTLSSDPASASGCLMHRSSGLMS